MKVPEKERKNLIPNRPGWVPQSAEVGSQPNPPQQNAQLLGRAGSRPIPGSGE